MTGRAPLVSVVVPAFNAAAYLGAAIASVRAQTYPRLEIIVVDDGSTDDTPAVIASLGGQVRGVRQEQRGIGAARNAGVRLATGDVVAFLDADDLFSPEKTATQVRALAEDCARGMVFGHVQEFVSDDLSPAERVRLRAHPEPQPGYCASAMLIRREALAAVGPFPEDVRVGEFVDWFLRATELGLPHVLGPEVVLRRRLHRSNISVREPRARRDFARILKASLDRRRARRAGGGV
jgi:glycosyltransferase involved in cell wall biosynthesis